MIFTLIKELALNCFEVSITSGSLILRTLLRVLHLLIIHPRILLLIASLGIPLHLLLHTWLHLHLRWSRTVMRFLMTSLRETSAASSAAPSHIALTGDRLRWHAWDSRCTIHHRWLPWLCSRFSILNRSLSVFDLFLRNWL